MHCFRIICASLLFGSFNLSSALAQKGLAQQQAVPGKGNGSDLAPAGPESVNHGVIFASAGIHTSHAVRFEFKYFDVKALQ